MVPDRPGDFSAQAAAYARSRPPYPGDLVERLLARVGVRRGDRVLEIGAGTGAFTRMLAERGLHVVAVEPCAAMRARAPVLEGVHSVEGTFEAPGVTAGSQRWVVAAQAFHWADPARALPALHDALEDGGSFTVLWNVRRTEDEPLLGWVMARIRDLAPDFDDIYRLVDWGEVLTGEGLFEGVVRDERNHVVAMDAERFVALWESHHRLRLTVGEEALAGLLVDLRRHLEHEAITEVRVPYSCRAWTVRRA